VAEPGGPQAPLDRDKCGRCDTLLVGEYCHACGQHRVRGRLTLRLFLTDVMRRILRLDKDFVVTFWRTLWGPGALTNDYLAGRRRDILDPLHYFVSSVFAQFVVSSITRALAPLINRESAMSWLGALGGIVAIKLGLILWAGGLWRLMFRSRTTNLAEIYVFTTYAASTTGLLWALLPLVDLLVPFDLARSEASVASITLGIEVIYVTYAVHDWLPRSLWRVFLGVASVLFVGYAILAAVLGVDQAVSFAPLSALTR
jgi:hypothetical protein